MFLALWNVFCSSHEAIKTRSLETSDGGLAVGMNCKRAGCFAALQLILAASAFIASSLAADVDERSASISCTVQPSGQQITCDYRHTAALDVKDVSLKVGAKTVQIPSQGLSNYPANGQTTALLFLVDVSDPNRKNTVEKKNVEAITEMLVNQKPHQKVGVAVFDSDIRLLTPIAADVAAARNAVSEIKAAGQATEFYKNILAAIALLQKTDATRKGLILMSDGKDEDRAYKHDDVIKAAEKAGVVILGLGYLERPTDSPYLQTLKRLADDTFGLYFDATDQKLPQALLRQPFAFAESGGRVTFDTGTTIGKQEIAVTLGTKDGGQVELKTAVEFPDQRTKARRTLDFVIKFWPFLLGGSAALILALAILLRLRRRKQLEAPRTIEYGYLDALDGSGTRYPITKTAARIGRSAESDVYLLNSSISSHHAEIHRRREGSFYIVDLASTNGVYVNDAKVAQVELHDGDLIELGEVRLRFHANTPAV